MIVITYNLIIIVLGDNTTLETLAGLSHDTNLTTGHIIIASSYSRKTSLM